MVLSLFRTLSEISIRIVFKLKYEAIRSMEKKKMEMRNKTKTSKIAAFWKIETARPTLSHKVTPGSGFTTC